MVQSVAMPACMERLTVSPASFSLFRFSLEPPSPQANAVERSPQALLACHTHRSVHLARLGLGVMAKAWISSQLPQRVSEIEWTSQLQASKGDGSNDFCEPQTASSNSFESPALSN